MRLYICVNPFIKNVPIVISSLDSPAFTAIHVCCDLPHYM